MRTALAGLVLLGAPVALALPKDRLQTAQQVGHDRGDPLCERSRGAVPCVTCHTRPQGGPGWNPFGQSLRAGFRADPAARFGAVPYAVLAAHADADTYPDAPEFYALTLPGDPASRPERPLAEVQADFLAAVGVERYRLEKEPGRVPREPQKTRPGGAG